MQADITLEQKFDFITKGLKFVGRFGMDTNNAQWNNRKKLPEMWKVEQNRDSDGKLVPTKVRGEEIMSQQSSSTGEQTASRTGRSIHLWLEVSLFCGL